MCIRDRHNSQINSNSARSIHYVKTTALVLKPVPFLLKLTAQISIDFTAAKKHPSLCTWNTVCSVPNHDWMIAVSQSTVYDTFCSYQYWNTYNNVWKSTSCWILCVNIHRNQEWKAKFTFCEYKAWDFKTFLMLVKFQLVIRTGNGLVKPIRIWLNWGSDKNPRYESDILLCRTSISMIWMSY